MATRSSKIGRLMTFFREGDKDEVRAVALMAAEVLAARGILVPAVPSGPAGPVVVKKQRKPRVARAAAAAGTTGASAPGATE